MADKSNERDVLTSLPRTRPARRSAKRAPAGTDGSAPAPAKPAAAKPKATATKSKAAAKPKATAAKSKAAAKPRAKAAAKPRAKAAAKPRAAGTTKPATAGDPVGAAVPPAGYATPADPSPSRAGGPNDVLSTGVQAAEELASIGVTLLRQVARSLATRLPKP